MNVFVYYNIRKKLWSVRYEGLVICHLNKIVLKDVTFKVSEAGRQRVLKEQRKNVHAGVQGELATEFAIDQWWRTKNGYVATARYNPYKYKTFVKGVEDKPIYRADVIHMVALPRPNITAYIRNES